jgi:hypothetical protein
MSAAATPARKPARVAVYDGQVRLGSILAHSKFNFEAIDRDGRSLGIFSTRCEAADALEVCSCPLCRKMETEANHESDASFDIDSVSDGIVGEARGAEAAE